LERYPARDRPQTRIHAKARELRTQQQFIREGASIMHVSCRIARVWT